MPGENREIHPVFDRLVERGEKERLLGQRGLVVWLYGLSGAGKSTLAAALDRRLHAEGRLVQVLDGDNIRTGLNRDLGFSEADREENIRRIAEVSRLFAQAGLITITSFICPLRRFRELARDIVGREDFMEVWVRCDYETCEQRDVKGLYRKAREGGLSQFTGRDAAFEAPEHPELMLDTGSQDLAESLRILHGAVRGRLEGAGG